ncbi:hypothetical protein ACTJIJ_15070 [Niabella sp. 22666]|jgi:hypothetical protein|uniref:hypothetical protein n=1 Tax=Niabella sp. 22666 TaxID=3453954 RepID=UPI003F86790E
MEHLIVMHCDKRLEDGERLLLEQWISQCNENNKVYKETVFIWKNAKFRANKKYINIEHEWSKLRNIINQLHR